MDAVSIILTIGAVIAGLFLLWVIVMSLFALIARGAVIRFNRKVERDRMDFRKCNGLL